MNGEKVKVAIVGSTGYGGVELIRFLWGHPAVEIVSVISASSAGAPISEGFPHLSDIIVQPLDAVEAEEIAAKAEVVFTATPSGVSGKLVPELLKAGLKVIDLSGDFRLKDGDVYETWYKHEAPDSKLLEQAVYGLSEVYGDEVPGAGLISNPGCYPTATLLGLIPALSAGWIDPGSIIIDAKSGVSGSGRGTSLTTHYAEINENLKAYKVNKHQHIPEIEQILSQVAGEPVTVTFTTHLAPMTRGIMSTIYAGLKGAYTEDDLIQPVPAVLQGAFFCPHSRKRHLAGDERSVRLQLLRHRVCGGSADRKADDHFRDRQHGQRGRGPGDSKLEPDDVLGRNGRTELRSSLSVN